MKKDLRTKAEIEKSKAEGEALLVKTGVKPAAAQQLPSEQSVSSLKDDEWTLNEDELWDEHSKYIGDSLDDLQDVAGSSVITRHSFYFLIRKIKQSHQAEIQRLKAGREGNP